ncbi:ATP-grasp fold amidoligase family protein [Acinetobacter sp.]|jgi:hypothetical protein|uniref:ATP-grasp fold amidoligase family protein n=1 Tax=Acinetobacter sp. TaxID=472 RepID=UPI0028188B5C|nr:ATP-grasp fold amidoligase family protein [Acinetobacter sp.]MDR0235198.1 glycosyltransferase [Acinetobacter sp.]
MYNHLTYLAKVIRTYFVSDRSYLTKRFLQKLGYLPNIYHPQSFNEKVTSRMIYERDPLHTTLADKLAVREVIVDKNCASHVVPLLGVYHHFREINFDQLPAKFVLKCNHDSGSAMVCKDKNLFDFKKAERNLTRHLKQNMYYLKREWHYKNIKPVILVEEYVELLSDQETQLTITTCRVHCFEGQAQFIEVDIQDQFKNEYSNIYDLNWVLQPFTVDLKNNSPVCLKQPVKLDIMLDLSQTLCLKYGYSRVDFLITHDHIYFSEITLTPNAGRMIISPSEWDSKLGEYWQSF